MDNQEFDLGRLKWMCRRGMLELDILLERFVDRGIYLQLSTDNQQLFEALMQEPDPVLLAWFMGNEAPKQTFSALVETIRAETKP
jgi:antitoxin CptB